MANNDRPPTNTRGNRSGGRPPQSAAGGGSSFLTQKFGPLPVWGWIAAAVVGLYLYRRQTASSAAGTAAPLPTPAPTAATGGVSPVVIQTGAAASPGGTTGTFTGGGGTATSPGQTSSTSTAATGGGDVVAAQQAALLGSYSKGGYTQGEAMIPGQGTYIAVQPGQAFPTGTETYAELTQNVFTPIPGNLPSFGGQQYVLNTGHGYQMG